ncbi:SpoIIIAH-like family protein [Pseudalkalibacillus salsuginis]|uniref:SpoIIIAH-like family protein n=1 Tax=Pseudalkalibacillus salsuginis TaxID=2910972 RepID=UPI001F296B02|nr:SpoIIIAH-like family protein [Pseudalkalibacillus salsuginis]MCF6408401.1 SpoIIIAH-like family protein [Pseudalkalibacillus salsuginis]
MLLKKQTVWLLTMLSLIIVLSVYYITTPEQSPTDFAAQNEDKKESAKEATGDSVVTEVDSDEMFTELRMKIEDKRSELQDKYNEVLASTSVSAEVQSQALGQLEELQELAMKEETLETLIKGMGYEDVLVNTMDAEVQIIVRANEELSKSEANAIMRKAQEQLGNKHVAVQFQVAKN